MIREIIKPQTQSHTIEIPKEYLNMEVEILIFPIGSTKPHSDQSDHLIRKTSGILSGRKVDPIIWQREIRSEWDNRK
ncbi:MAG: hypothetical protein A2277_16805 [Desulfobacterales bacterium RIFOXYA12_FULL_46_15]|nr:MAG: hypothetical protein A2277_16805 [Desulfobacterales bacterium RIFOXYA12_FULL_46_15]